MLTIHATCVSLNGAAMLLRGPSGCGKSDLAFRMIEAGARLVADDRTVLVRADTQLVASAPDEIRGLLEIRGLGPVEMIPAPPAPVILVADLVASDDVPRMPEPDGEEILGVVLPRLNLAAFTASAASIARLALARAAAGRLFTPAEARSLRPASGALRTVR